MTSGGLPLLGPGLSPGARIRALRRMRRLSQHGLLLALEHQAGLLGSHLASRASLKVQISRWENDHQIPDDFHRHLLCRVFEVTEGDLGFPTTPDAGNPARPQLAPRLISPAIVDYFENVLQQYIVADHLLGPGC